MIQGNLALKLEEFEDSYCGLHLLDDREQSFPDNIIQFPLKNNTYSAYEHDYQNLIKKIIFPDASVNAFNYCRCGPVRRMKQDSTGTTKYLYDFDETYLLYDCDESWNVKAQYTLGLGIDEIISKKYLDGVTWKKIYYHYDGLGSVVALTDENGDLIGRYVYDSFGNIVSEPVGVDNRYTYTGREYDKDSGLYYYRARYYDAKVGRFTTVDPLLSMICSGYGGGGCGVITPTASFEHPYVYCLNNPVNYKDPTGEFVDPVTAAIILLIVIAIAYANYLAVCSDPCSTPEDIQRAHDAIPTK